MVVPVPAGVERWVKESTMVGRESAWCRTGRKWSAQVVDRSQRACTRKDHPSPHDDGHEEPDILPVQPRPRHDAPLNVLLTQLHRPELLIVLRLITSPAQTQGAPAERSRRRRPRHALRLIVHVAERRASRGRPLRDGRSGPLGCLAASCRRRPPTGGRRSDLTVRLAGRGRRWRKGDIEGRRKGRVRVGGGCRVRREASGRNGRKGIGTCSEQGLSARSGAGGMANLLPRVARFVCRGRPRTPSARGGRVRKGREVRLSGRGFRQPRRRRLVVLRRERVRAIRVGERPLRNGTS